MYLTFMVHIYIHRYSQIGYIKIIQKVRSKEIGRKRMLVRKLVGNTIQSEQLKAYNTGIIDRSCVCKDM